MNYFENIYLGNQDSNNSLKGNKNLQQLLSKKALNNSVDSKKLSQKDFKRINKRILKADELFKFDFDNFIYPYDFI